MKYSTFLLIGFLVVACTRVDPRTFKVTHLATGDTSEATICPCWGPKAGDTVRLGNDGIHSGLRETETGEQYILLEEVIKE